MQDQITSASSKTLALFYDHTLPPSSKQPPLLQVACVARCARAADAHVAAHTVECSIKEMRGARPRGVGGGAVGESERKSGKE
jgi:hypothetical protein